MDANRFDRLVQSLSTTPRRGLMRLLASLPLLGGLAALLGADEAEADGRRRRRKKRHKHGKGRHRGWHKNCKAKSRAKTCAGKCGRVKNTCKKKIDCGPCVECDVCASGCPFTSLQEAIDNAEPESAIRLCAETYGETFTIAKNLTLIGAGDSEDGTILDGQGNGTVVRVESGATVALEGVRITGGSSTIGGGVAILDGNLTLTDCTVTGNTTPVGGGGIYTANASSVVTLTNCTVSDNTAGQQGGGLYNPGGGSVTLNDSSVIGNEAPFAGGGIYNDGSFSGGGRVTLNGTSSVMGNTVDENQLGGGGIYNASDDSTVTLNDDSRVTSNTATGGEGGGIYNLSGAVTLNDDSRVVDNVPDDCDGSGTFNGNACG